MSAVIAMEQLVSLPGWKCSASVCVVIRQGTDATVLVNVTHFLSTACQGWQLELAADADVCNRRQQVDMQTQLHARSKAACMPFDMTLLLHVLG
jgi:hypothetical protein